MKPILKWVGGKRELTPKIREMLPPGFDPNKNMYYEPFLGGGAVLLDINPSRAKVSDINPELINVYRQVRDKVETVITYLTRIDAGHEEFSDKKAYYYLIRKYFNEHLGTDTPLQAACFIYLNKHCFNGLYRVNKKGEFNVPFNGKLTGGSFDADHLREVSKQIQNVHFLHNDFAVTVHDALPGDFCFIDSPYPVTASIPDSADTMKITFTEATPCGSPKGVHVFNLRTMYNAEMNPSSSVSSSAAFMADKECLRYMSRKIGEYAGYLQTQTALFNTEEKVKFVPRDRMVVEVLAYAEQAMNSVLQSDTFHNDLTALPLHRTTAAWQGLGDGINGANSEIAFTDISRINAIVDDGSTGTTVNIDGVVAFMCDKWAIMHTIRSERVAARNFDPEALDLYFYQFRDSYLNNLGLPAVVFRVD